MENILELQQVSKTFSKSKFSLENVSFNLPYGAIMGFVGENGAGKTTLVKLLCRLYSPTEGTILINGFDICRYNKEEYYKLITAVFQDINVL